jgi:hypothetical protein
VEEEKKADGDMVEEAGVSYLFSSIDSGIEDTFCRNIYGAKFSSGQQEQGPQPRSRKDVLKALREASPNSPVGAAE